MVLKLLGIGKKSEYFLEAPPSSNGASSGEKAPAPAAKPAVEAPAKAVEAAKPEATANGATATSAPAQPAAKKLKKTKAEAAPAQPTATPQPVAKAAPEVKNFATNGLMPMNTPRRRPGPSMAMFKDMARDVTPRK